MIQLSDAAIAEILRLRKKHPNPKAFFRLKVLSGGCSGLLYQTHFDDTAQPSDQTFHFNDLSILIDPTTLPLIHNLQLDYAEDLMGGSFRFHNPHASKTCGCGISFSATER
jgi:iron-sulfur cluster assembly protein